MTDEKLRMGDPVDVLRIEHAFPTRSKHARGDALVETRRVWVPATVCSVTRSVLGVALADGSRLALPKDGEPRRYRRAR